MRYLKKKCSWDAILYKGNITNSDLNDFDSEIRMLEIIYDQFKNINSDNNQKSISFLQSHFKYCTVLKPIYNYPPRSILLLLNFLCTTVCLSLEPI